MKINFMKFSYSNKRLFLNLILGIIWLGIGISYFFEKNAEIKYKPYFLIILGLLYILLFSYDFYKKYFEISKESIKINSIPTKEINLNELIEVKYYADDFIFRTPNKSIKIVKSQINQKQLPEFENFFNNLQKELK